MTETQSTSSSESLASSQASSESSTPRRGRRRDSRRDVASGPEAPRPLVRKVPTYDLLDDASLALVESNADQLLEDIGLNFPEDEESRDILKAAGANVDGERVRFPQGMCREIVQRSAPSEFMIRARDPERSMKIGGKNTVFAPVYGSPFVHDLDEGRRYGTIKDFQNFVKLVYMLPQLHMSGGTVCEPVDVPVEVRHLDMVRAHLVLSNKAIMGSVTAPERAADSVEMLKIVFGQDTVAQNCCMVSLINANSPLTWDDTMLGALKVYARAGQGVLTSPFILSGAMSPVSPIGTMTQSLAEALAGLTLAQLINPGTPCIMGSFASTINMQTGAPTFGTPESLMVLYGMAQLARRLGVPFRSGGSYCASKLPDAQAATEAANTLNATLLAGVNFVLHSAGWLEGGLVSSYEKLVMDADLLGMLQRFAEGVDTSENGQAMDAFHEVGPGQHYLGCDHTQRNFRTAFYQSKIADSNSYEQWIEDGSLDAAQRANKRFKMLLETYEPPHMDAATISELDSFIAQRKSEITG